ncbi:MAG: hypothetical protein R3357_14135 [Burkholderiales bacterium]|nr:hypothetical protein [Burkholderiales bacterium]
MRKTPSRTAAGTPQPIESRQAKWRATRATARATAAGVAGAGVSMR